MQPPTNRYTDDHQNEIKMMEAAAALPKRIIEKFPVFPVFVLPVFGTLRNYVIDWNRFNRYFSSILGPDEIRNQVMRRRVMMVIPSSIVRAKLHCKSISMNE